MLTHDGREIKNEGIDYQDGNVMIQYTDTNEIAIVPKSEIEKSE